MVWYLLKNFPQFVVIHTVKCFGLVNKAEVDVFLELSCVFNDPMDVVNLAGLSIWSLCHFEHHSCGKRGTSKILIPSPLLPALSCLFLSEESEAECGSADLGPLLICIPVGLGFSGQMGLWKLQAHAEFLLSWGGLGILPEGLFLSWTLPSALVYSVSGRGNRPWDKVFFEKHLREVGETGSGRGRGESPTGVCSQAWSLRVLSLSHVQRWRPAGPALISHVWPLTPRRADLLEVSRSQRARGSFNSSRSEGALCSRPTAGCAPTTLESQSFSGDCGSL